MRFKRLIASVWRILQNERVESMKQIKLGHSHPERNNQFFQSNLSVITANDMNNICRHISFEIDRCTVNRTANPSRNAVSRI